MGGHAIWAEGMDDVMLQADEPYGTACDGTAQEERQVVEQPFCIRLVSGPVYEKQAGEQHEVCACGQCADGYVSEQE